MGHFHILTTYNLINYHCLKNWVPPFSPKNQSKVFFWILSCKKTYEANLLSSFAGSKLSKINCLLTVSSHAQLFCWWVPEHKTVFELSVQIWLPGKNGEQKNLCSLWRSFIAGQQPLTSHSFIASVPGGQMWGVALSHLLILSHAKKRSSAKFNSAKNGGIVFWNIFISI